MEGASGSQAPQGLPQQLLLRQQQQQQQMLRRQQQQQQQQQQQHVAQMDYSLPFAPFAQQMSQWQTPQEPPVPLQQQQTWQDLQTQHKLLMYMKQEPGSGAQSSLGPFSAAQQQHHQSLMLLQLQQQQQQWQQSGSGMALGTPTLLQPNIKGFNVGFSATYGSGFGSSPKPGEPGDVKGLTRSYSNLSVNDLLQQGQQPAKTLISASESTGSKLLIGAPNSDSFEKVLINAPVSDAFASGLSDHGGDDLIRALTPTGLSSSNGGAIGAVGRIMRATNNYQEPSMLGPSSPALAGQLGGQPSLAAFSSLQLQQQQQQQQQSLQQQHQMQQLQLQLHMQAERKRKHVSNNGGLLDAVDSLLAEPAADKKHRAAGPAYMHRVLANSVFDSSIEDVVEAMRAADQEQLNDLGVPRSSTAGVLVAIATDREKRTDRFHRKKTGGAEGVINKIAVPFKKKGSKAADAEGDDDGDDEEKAHSSGQGCTIVVVSKKCNRHRRGAVCNFNENHEPHDFTVTREHITRSNVGKWFNVFVANLAPHM